jgi:hypothetical protein
MKKLILIIIPFLLLQSCVPLLLRVAGVLNEEARFETFTNDAGKEVVFIPMKHIGTAEFYSSVGEIVDSFTHSGFVVLYEGAKPSFDDSLRIDTLERRMRKIMGMRVGSGYYDTTNQVIAGKIEYKGKKKITNQPPYAKMGVDMDKAVRVDVASDQLVEMFDAEHHIPPLDSCDFQTPLSAEYPCGTMHPNMAKKFMRELILDYRNKHLADYIAESEDPKMLVIYGALHLKGTFEELEKMDPSWKMN